MTETTTERKLRLMDERMEAIDSMKNLDGSVGEDYHAMEIAKIQSARLGIWSSSVNDYADELVEIEDENIRSWS